METRNRFGESSVLRELFEEDSSDFLLTVFDHLDVRHIVFVCSPASRRVREVVRQWYPWRATALNWRGVASDIMAEQYVWAAHLHFVKEQNLDCQIEFAESQREVLLQAVMQASPKASARILADPIVSSWFRGAKKHCSQCGEASTWVDHPACKSCGSTWNLHCDRREGVAQPQDAAEPSAFHSRRWATEDAPKVMRGAELLLSVGEYTSAEQLLLLLVGLEAACILPDDRIVESGFHEVLEAALELLISRYCSAITASAEHRAASLHALLLLAQIAEAKRATLHYFDKMLPCAIRVAAFAGALCLIYRQVYLLYWCKSTNTGVAKFCNAFATDKHALQQAVEIEEVQAAEALRLYGASKAWKLLGTSRPPDAIYQHMDLQSGVGLSFEKGVCDAEEALRSSFQLFRKHSRMVCAAKAQQALGTCCYVRAAFLFDSPAARDWYEAANGKFLAANDLLIEHLGEHHLDVATCAIDLAISFGNRRRTVDFTEAMRREALLWYYKAYSIRKMLLGEHHPLSQRALFGFNAHASA